MKSANVDNAINKYCTHYAEADIQHLQGFPADKTFQHVVVVPAYNEDVGLIARLQHLADPHSGTLIILVINQPDNDTDIHSSIALLNAARQSAHSCRTLTSGASSCRTLADHAFLDWESAHLNLLEWRNNSALLTVDRFSSAALRIPRQQGVGLARKIGCDLAVALRERNVLTADFIHNTDADATPPPDYLQQTRNMHGVSAALYPFRHRTAGDTVGEATQLYETSLRYYVNGLQWAGSPYAFHTIGSCIAISLYHYCLARGFPKRAGGEDFYLLNKLAKLAPVTSTAGSPVQLQARRSSRVPFGTGPAVEKILQLPSAANFETYDPRVFVDLATLLEHFQDLCRNRPSQGKLSYQSWLASLATNLQNACVALNVEQLFRHLSRQACSEAQCQRHIHDWFDAFRTLKFIHYLQQHSYPPVALSVALDQATFVEFFAPSLCRKQQKISNEVLP
jgi:hypothetical protein